MEFNNSEEGDTDLLSQNYFLDNVFNNCHQKDQTFVKVVINRIWRWKTLSSITVGVMALLTLKNDNFIGWFVLKNE